LSHKTSEANVLASDIGLRSRDRVDRYRWGDWLCDLRQHERKGGNGKSAKPPTPSIPNVGDSVIMNSSVVACPVPEDVDKVRALLRTSTDRQPAASYAVEHRCMVFPKSKSFKVEAQSVQRGTACLRVPGQPQCYWTPADALDVARK
jgi:hypothetical protein